MRKIRYSTYNYWTEYMSIVFGLFNATKFYIFLNLFDIFRLKVETTKAHKLNNEHNFLSYIFHLDILFDFSKINHKIKNITFPDVHLNLI